MLTVCQLFLCADLSSSRCRTFLSAVLVPVLQALSGPASRTMLSVVVKTAKLHPRPTMEGLVLPLLAGGEAMGAAQAEVRAFVITKFTQTVEE